MSPETELSDAALGARLAEVLDRRVDIAGAPDARPTLERVRTGAHRRQRRTRAAVGAGCAVALVLVGGAIAVRTTAETTPAAPPPTTIPARPPVLSAFAMLTDDSGELLMPVHSYADRGGRAFGIALPAIDVWLRGSETLVVRTVDERPQPDADDVSAATTAPPGWDDSEPWRDRTVEHLPVRGANGAIEALADDQFAVWVPQGSQQRYTLVIGRGMTRDAVLNAVDGLVPRDGVLEPGDDFVAVERVPSVPAASPTSPSIQLGYASASEPTDGADAMAAATTWISTGGPQSGRSSLESMSVYDFGSVEQVGDRAAVVVERYGRRTVAWVDPSGLQIIVATDDPAASLDDLVRRVTLASETDWLVARRQMAPAIMATIPDSGHATVGDVDVQLRAQEPMHALCLTLGESTDCGAIVVQDPEPGFALHAEAEIDGHWVIAGYWKGGEDETSIADMSFVDDAGNPVAAVDWTYQDGAYWYAVQIPDGVDVVTTNLGNVVGGVVGQLSRPAGMSVNA